MMIPVVFSRATHKVVSLTTHETSSDVAMERALTVLSIEQIPVNFQRGYERPLPIELYQVSRQVQANSTALF